MHIILEHFYLCNTYIRIVDFQPCTPFNEKTFNEHRMNIGSLNPLPFQPSEMEIYGRKSGEEKSFSDVVVISASEFTVSCHNLFNLKINKFWRLD